MQVMPLQTARDPILVAAAPAVASIFMTITGRELQ